MMLQPHPQQEKVFRSKARFKIIRAGRRSCKSTLEVEDMCCDAAGGAGRNIFYTCPTRIQARAIIWEALKARLLGVATFNESRLEAKVPTIDGGFSTIYLAGWENRENFRG